MPNLACPRAYCYKSLPWPDIFASWSLESALSVGQLWHRGLRKLKLKAQLQG